MKSMRCVGGLLACVLGGLFLVGCATTEPTRAQRPVEVMPAGAVEEVQITIWVRGLDCTSCVRLLRKEMMEVPGMQDVIIDPSMGTLTAVWQVAGEPTQEPLIEALERAGFTAVRVAMPEGDAG
jgi:hypothetical protein